ncbi:AzlC family ABC transporter permease [Nitratireductor sp. XY-223]|uniref:AzlC family ABC transporter permease n=1 Tax=Nitratireductor sp. XY-223 TaxID=2561926 RepID=UPI0010AB4822|nr:AzlC family ABC transporter permease [Nitratireductor sp. XY-223]
MSTPTSFRKLPWFLSGMRGIFSGPALVLMSAFVGFCGFAYEAGIPVGQALFMSGMVWALPGQFVLIGAIIAGASLPTAALAVALSSMRLMPMVASLVPEIKSRDTPTWVLLLISHFVAVTAWVFTMERVHLVPREGRVAFFAGFGVAITTTNLLIVAILYGVISHLPAMIGGALFFLTPVYFITSIWASARGIEVYFAMLAGLFLGPLFHTADPELGILYAGVIGGTLAFLLERLVSGHRRRKNASR